MARTVRQRPGGPAADPRLADLPPELRSALLHAAATMRAEHAARSDLTMALCHAGLRWRDVTTVLQELAFGSSTRALSGP